MKKSLLALAVLAASGAAFAQSSVTLYGRVDLGITKITGQSAVMADGSSVGTSSRIGFRGVEDLGGGLKAGFLVETQFDADASKNGGAGSTIGSRNSYIDLMGGFGGVRLGRHLNPALLFAGALTTVMPTTLTSCQSKAHVTTTPFLTWANSVTCLSCSLLL